MKVRAIKEFNDLEANTVRLAGAVFDVGETRGAALTSGNNRAGCPLCVEVKETEGEKPETKKRKKKGE